MRQNWLQDNFFFFIIQSLFVRLFGNQDVNKQDITPFSWVFVPHSCITACTYSRTYVFRNCIAYKESASGWNLRPHKGRLDTSGYYSQTDTASTDLLAKKCVVKDAFCKGDIRTLVINFPRITELQKDKVNANDCTMKITEKHGILVIPEVTYQNLRTVI